MNAKTEFIELVEGKEVKCAAINYQECWDKRNPDSLLPIGYDQEQYNQFIESLDYDYDNGYGGQSLFGTVWLKDGTWATRGEYDGSEWWDHHDCPEIPKELIGEPKIAN